MLDHVQARDQVERLVLPGKLLEPSHQDLAVARRRGDLGGVGVELDAAYLSVVDQLLERAARAAPRVQHTRGVRQWQPVELRAHDPPAPAVPPVVLVDLQHRLHQPLVHSGPCCQLPDRDRVLLRRSRGGQ